MIFGEQCRELRSLPSLVVNFVVWTDTLAALSSSIFRFQNLRIDQWADTVGAQGEQYRCFIEEGPMVAQDFVIDFEHCVVSLPVVRVVCVLSGDAFP